LERGQRVLEAREVALQQQVERPSGRTGGSHPAAQHGRAGLLLGLGEEVQEDRQLRLVVELAGDDGERVGVEGPEQLLLAQAQQLLQALCGGRAQNSWFPDTDGTRPR
jgi:hypothetical protein